MKEGTGQVVSTLIMVVALTGYIAFLFYMHGGNESQKARLKQKLRYYKWRTWWDSLPSWKQEALIVRGRGPV